MASGTRPLGGRCCRPEHAAALAKIAALSGQAMEQLATTSGRSLAYDERGIMNDGTCMVDDVRCMLDDGRGVKMVDRKCVLAALWYDM